MPCRKFIVGWNYSKFYRLRKNMERRVMKVNRTQLRKIILHEISRINEAKKFNTLTDEEKACAMIGYIEKYLKQLPTSEKSEQTLKLADLYPKLKSARDTNSKVDPGQEYKGVVTTVEKNLNNADAVEDLGGMDALIRIGRSFESTTTRRGS